MIGIVLGLGIGAVAIAHGIEQAKADRKPLDFRGIEGPGFVVYEDGSYKCEGKRACEIAEFRSKVWMEEVEQGYMFSQYAIDARLLPEAAMPGEKVIALCDTDLDCEDMEDRMDYEGQAWQNE